MERNTFRNGIDLHIKLFPVTSHFVCFELRYAAGVMFEMGSSNRFRNVISGRCLPIGPPMVKLYKIRLCFLRIKTKL